jgi:hypothetical protein
MVPSEGELLFLPNTEFKVKLALSCDEARFFADRFKAILSDNVDLVILEPAIPKPHTKKLYSRPVRHSDLRT